MVVVSVVLYASSTSGEQRVGHFPCLIVSSLSFLVSYARSKWGAGTEGGRGQEAFSRCRFWSRVPPPLQAVVCAQFGLLTRYKRPLFLASATKYRSEIKFRATKNKHVKVSDFFSYGFW